MNKHLKQLIDLAQVDKEIDAFEPQIEEANYNYEAALAKTKSIEPNQQKVWSEKEIAAMSIAEFDKHESAISEAMQYGRIVK
mgnify:CR=1 FL=1